MRRGPIGIAIGVALVLAAAGLFLALAPFARPGGNGTVLTSGPYPDQLSRRCGPPIVSAFDHEQFTGGWVGYAPLASPPSPTSLASPVCRPGARTRLALSVVLWLAAAFALLIVWKPRVASPRIAPA